MMNINLNKGKIAFVDKEDFNFLIQWKWYVTKNGHYPFTEYAMRNRHKGDKSTEIFMHRAIMEKHNKKINTKLVDHINHNGLDNRKENMRIATRSQNKANGKIYSNNTSGYKGVSFEKSKNNWKAYIAVNGVDKNLGRYKTKEEAALAYNQAAKEYFGKFAYLNQIGGTI